MKNSLFTQFCMLLTVLFTGIGVQAQEQTSVLFIGNSFTFMNNMPFMFRDIAIASGKKIHVDTVVEGGKNFNYHATNPETYEKIKERKWDYIIIQGHSNELAQPESKIDKSSLPFAQQIVDSIRANSSCTQVVLYMTWAYKFGNPKWAPIASYDSMQLRIKNQYLRFADLLDARVSPVGEVWKNVRTNHSGINLYYSDNQHPSLAGSYLSACTFYTSIFGESPYKNSAIFPLETATRNIIELNAAQTVLNQLNQWRFVPKNTELSVGFDLKITGRKVQLYDNSKNASWLEWNFGDGHLSTDQNPVHEFSADGTYQVVQKVSKYCKTLSLVRSVEVKL